MLPPVIGLYMFSQMKVIGLAVCVAAGVTSVKHVVAIEPAKTLSANTVSENVGHAGRDEEQSSSIDFNRDIRPILSEYCLACHGFDSNHRAAGLRLDQRDGALSELESGSYAIVPNNLELSALIERITTDDVSTQMPPIETGKKLDQQQIDLLKRWIEQGAEYAPHWSFAPIIKPIPPSSSHDSAEEKYVSSWGNPVDAFIYDELRKREIIPSSRAEPETLIRRVYLDLIGLLPKVEEVQRFKTDFEDRGNLAFQEIVEELLSSPHYGERWGRWWLDQARYADSNGYSIDSPRSIWPYRDWVVNALNSDMHWDQFVIEQIAGDLLSNPSQGQLIATGFHRNTQFNEEGGIDPEQFRIERVFDRVATTGTVFLGLTIGCAQCHDHKFDPISQKEYYQLFAFFNDQDEPTIQVEIINDAQALSTTVAAENKESNDSKKANIPTTLVLKERQESRSTHVFTQGDFTRPAESVVPGVPEVLPALEPNKDRYNRLDLANWIVAPENPLTSRVLVNRVWQKYFGQGIVATENDFGLQSSVPTHPELLDWLASHWRESSLSLKDLHRQIVCSDVYMRDSRARQELLDSDRSNLYLAKQVRLRLDAEIVRDVGLVASGLLSPKLGGEPVFPPIPDGVMSQGQVRRNWKPSIGADRYRRGLYTFLYRATPPPSLSVFDAPEGNATCTQRNRSNTPLQALTLLNDASQFEFALALQKIVEEQGIEYAFQRCTSRLPSERELNVLRRLDTLSAARVLLNLDETITRE